VRKVGTDMLNTADKPVFETKDLTAPSHVRLIGKKTSSKLGQNSSELLVDCFGRIQNDLRISVTDNCNLRCIYCLPEEGIDLFKKKDIMSFEQITAVARIFKNLGVNRVRLTGGEPLMRRGLDELIYGLNAIGFEDISLTTNGMNLAGQALRLKEAGLKRVNISCDSLNKEKFAKIRRRGNLDTVLKAMDKSEEANLLPVKINVVVIRGVNDDEILDFIRFAIKTKRCVRFIEYMPLDATGLWNREKVVTLNEIIKCVSLAFPIQEEVTAKPTPARTWNILGQDASFGIIASVSEPFCKSCNRLRLTADGKLKSCLFGQAEYDLKKLFSRGDFEQRIIDVINTAVKAKGSGHIIGRPEFRKPARTMSKIGG